MKSYAVLPILALALNATAQTADPPPPGPPTEPSPLQPPPPDAPAPTRWEGAIGAITSYAPTYQGANAARVKVDPGFFLRYGRFTITNASGFVTRRADDVLRGLGVDLSPSDRLRVNLALRFDRGRQESVDPSLAGLGDIKSTVRARLGATYRFDDGWRAGFSWSVDAFGRGGGNLGDISVGRESRLSPDTVWSWNWSLAAAGDRYLQTYYGISEEQAARTGYPVYTPGAGLRDTAASIGFRSELSRDWLLIGGIGASRLLGPAASSPLTKNRNGWGMNLGLAWRF